MAISKGALAAQRLMEQCGLDDPTELPIETIVFGRGATLREQPINNADGRIVFGKSKAVITVNSNIEHEGKRRFVIAHELGHFEMHRNLLPVYADNDNTLEWYKSGSQEAEANEFASEILMPCSIFRKECKGKTFSPELLRSLSDRFQTSITSVVYRYIELGPHPICAFYSFNNKVKYYKKSSDFNYWIPDLTNLPPPSDSVATEFYKEKRIYSKEESQQEINKSTWLTLRRDEQDSLFYEYAIVTAKYNTVLSVVWED